MDLQPAEIIDKMTILEIKIEKAGGSLKEQLKIEYEEYQKALEEFKKQGIEIKKEWFEKLYYYNKEQWDIYSQLREEKEGKRDLEKIGRLYLAVEKSNKSRVAIKNEIVNMTGKGFRDIKMN